MTGCSIELVGSAAFNRRVRVLAGRKQRLARAGGPLRYFGSYPDDRIMSSAAYEVIALT